MFKNKLNTNTTKQRVSKPKVNLDKRFFFFLRNAERKSHRGYEQDNNEKKQ